MSLSGRGRPSLYEQELRRSYESRHAACARKLDEMLDSKPSTSKEWLLIAILQDQLGYSNRSIEESLRMAELLEHDEAISKRKFGRYK